MVFTTSEFALFALVFFSSYALCPGAWRKRVLLAASYIFYGTFSAKFLLLLVASTVLDFAMAARIHRADGDRERRLLLTVSLFFNLGVLATFKYFNFFIESVEGALSAFGLEPNLPLLRVVVPVGISFYTFQTMSYTIDVYRRQLEPARSLLDFALYIGFFPQLVAGPIERASNLLPQIQRIGTQALRPDLSGLGWIALGAFKKAVIADNLAILVDATFADPQATYTPALWIGTYAFAIQIYCDFSGYSDIAVGLGRLFGIELVQNFRAPYAAAGPSEFWRRWHISLSTWFRDYLYIPLGGNRAGQARVYFNVSMVMMLMFLWHGAAWNFVACGVYASVVMVVCRWRPLVALGERGNASGGVVAALTTAVQRIGCFHIFCLGFSLFRAQSVADCGIVFSKLLGFAHWDLSGWLLAVEASGQASMLAWVGALIVAVVLSHNVLPGDSAQLIRGVWRFPVVARVAFTATLLYLAAVLNPPDSAPFVYFAF